MNTPGDRYSACLLAVKSDLHTAVGNAMQSGADAVPAMVQVRADAMHLSTTCMSALCKPGRLAAVLGSRGEPVSVVPAPLPSFCVMSSW
jgi:hypothetical protein